MDGGFSFRKYRNGNVAGLLREKFMAEGFEESLVREELDKLGLRVSYKEGHAAITLRYPE